VIRLLWPQSRLAPLAAAALALATGGCSTGFPGLTTGALGGGAATAAAKAPPQSDAASRAMSTAATSARAEKCGFHFDPTKLKSSFIAAEAARGLPPEQMPGIDRLYEYTRRSLADRIASEPGYCSEAQVAVTKSSLSRHLAGDFEPPPPAADDDGGLFSGLGSNSGQAKQKQIFGPLPE
jgi:hypothetical protein